MNTSTLPNPSAVARSVAASSWPDVQSQKKLALGIYNFECAGHGGIIAVLGEADLPDECVEAARKSGLIGLYAKIGRRSYNTAAGYGRETLTAHAALHGGSIVEVWIGEEDCDWATILYASPAAREGAKRMGWTGDDDDVRGCLERWNADYLTAVESGS